MHAVNILKAKDNGTRRCILVTNNEVSESEAKSLTKKGHNPGDDEWEALVKRSAGQSANWRKIIRIGMCIASTAVRNGIRLQGA